MALALEAHADIGLVTTSAPGKILSPWCNIPCNSRSILLQVKHPNLVQWNSSNSGSSKDGSSWLSLPPELPSVNRQEMYSTSPESFIFMVTLFWGGLDPIRSLVALENLSQKCMQIVFVLFTTSHTVVGEENADTAITE